jgi:putative membrane protein
LQRWIVNTLAVLVASLVVGGISYARPLDLLLASLVLGLLNAFVRPLLLLLSLPLLVVTLGLFTLVINALLLYLVGWLLHPNFRVDSFGSAFWGALIITFVSFLLNRLTGTAKLRFTVRRGRSRPPSNPAGPDDGPVIDV